MLALLREFCGIRRACMSSPPCLSDVEWGVKGSAARSGDVPPDGEGSSAGQELRPDEKMAGRDWPTVAARRAGEASRRGRHQQ
jgi:hypothetical protein